MSQGQLERFDVEYLKGNNNISSKYKIVNLGDIAEFQYGLGESAQENGDLIYIRITDIDEFGLLKKDDLKFVTEQVNFGNSILQKGDILVARTGATYGKTLYFDEDFRATFGGFLIRIKLDTNIILPKYYYYFTHTSLYWNNAKQLVGGGGQPQFNANAVRQLKIPIPPLEIQNQIVEKMDFALNEKKRKEFDAKTLLESIDDFVLSELGIEYKEVEEKKVFGLNLSELGETKRLDSFYNNPKFLELEKMLKNGKYEVKKLDEIKEKIITGTTPLSTSEPYGENGVIFFRNTNLEKNNINLDDVKYVKEEFANKLTYSELNDVIVCIAGTIGVSATNNFGKIAINQNVSALRLKENILADYVSIFLNNKILVGFFDRVSSVATIKYINNENLLSIFLPLPTLEIQEKIALEIKSRIEKAKVLEKEAFEVYESVKREVEWMILD